MGWRLQHAETHLDTYRCTGETGDNIMIALRIAAVLLVALGVLALLFGGTGDDIETVLEAVNLPVWAGVAAILVGNAALLLTRPQH